MAFSLHVLTTTNGYETINSPNLQFMKEVERGRSKVLNLCRKEGGARVGVGGGLPKSIKGRG